MATYTYDGEVYDAEDDEIDHVVDREEIIVSQREQREMKILEIHPFLVNRIVIVKDSSNTRRKGWRSGAHSGKKGKKGKVIAVHENVLEAVKVQFGPDDDDPHFWHYKDLMMAEFEEEEIPPIYFNPLNLVV